MTTSQAVTTGGTPRRPNLRVVQTPTSDGQKLRLGQLEDFKLELSHRTNNRNKRFDVKTINAYRDAVIAWDKWLTENDFDEGFEKCTIRDYNGFLNDYSDSHSIGGTVTKQGNLRPFLRWIAEEFEIPNLWDHKKRNTYSRPDEPPPVLREEIIKDMLDVTSGKTFRDRRDHALIRMLLHGPRRGQIAGLSVEGLDLVSAYKSALLIGQKGGAEHRIGLGDKDVLALRRWLRERETHIGSATWGKVNRQTRARDELGDALFIAEKTARRLTGSGVYQILKRRAVQAGYEPEVIYTHLFRHTAAHEYLSDPNAKETDAMAHFGWKDRSMLDRYGRALAEQRAIEAASRMGFGDRH